MCHECNIMFESHLGCVSALMSPPHTHTQKRQETASALSQTRYFQTCNHYHTVPARKREHKIKSTHLRNKHSISVI